MFYAVDTAIFAFQLRCCGAMPAGLCIAHCLVGAVINHLSLWDVTSTC